MAMTDPIADFLTRIRNAQKARHSTVDIPASKMKVRLAEIFRKEGYISDFRMMPQKPQSELRLRLRYGPEGKPMIQELRRISRPGYRVYRGAEDLTGIASEITTLIISTSKGVMTAADAKESNVGGEVLISLR